MNILGVIPARAGSKGVPNKNVADVAGRPLVAYTIEEAKRSPALTRTIVSTDSESIAALCRALGADVPFLRPASLSEDRTPTLPVVLHAIDLAESQDGRVYDAIVLLQPTTPLRVAQDIDRCLELLLSSGADSVVSVVDVGGYHPLRMKKFAGGDRLVNYVDQEGENMRPRQELPPVYIRNGAVYASRRCVILDQGTLVGKDCRGYIMPPERSVNIDSPNDLIVADHLLRNRAPRRA